MADVAQLRSRLISVSGRVASLLSRDVDRSFEGVRTLNQAKRRLHCELELLLYDFEDAGGLPEDDASLVEDLKKKLVCSLPPKKITPETVLRLVFSFIYAMQTFPALLWLTPVRPFGYFFRLLGVKSNYLPVDWLLQLWYRALTRCMGITYATQNEGTLDTVTPSIYIFNHISNLDPFVFGSASPVVCKGVGKKVLFLIPSFGWIIRMMGFIPIDRSNLKSAIDSMDYAAHKVRAWSRSIFVAPEGTRSITGQLREFKKGAFHLALKTGAPITPVVLQGPFELWPPHQIFIRPGDVTVKFLPPIPVTADSDVSDLMRLARKALLKGIMDDKVDEASLRRPPLISRLCEYLMIAHVLLFPYVVIWLAWKYLLPLIW